MRAPLRPILAWVMLFGLALAGSAAASPAGSSVFTYRRIFKSSTPEFIEIKIKEDSDTGSYEIRQLDEDPGATSFEVSHVLRAKIFELSAQLNHFNGLDLDVHRKIANLGEKTFRWERGPEAHEVKFNYTLDDSATQLLNIFEGLTRLESDLSNLERAMRYDRLGVNDAVRQVESDYNEKLLPEPERLLPSLDRVASDSAYIDIARQRARALALRIRATH